MLCGLAGVELADEETDPGLDLGTALIADDDELSIDHAVRPTSAAALAIASAAELPIDDDELPIVEDAMPASVEVLQIDDAELSIAPPPRTAVRAPIVPPNGTLPGSRNFVRPGPARARHASAPPPMVAVAEALAPEPDAVPTLDAFAPELERLGRGAPRTARNEFVQIKLDTQWTLAVMIDFNELGAALTGLRITPGQLGTSALLRLVPVNRRMARADDTGPTFPVRLRAFDARTSRLVIELGSPAAAALLRDFHKRIG